jgi:hypothetical protein
LSGAVSERDQELQLGGSAANMERAFMKIGTA